MGLEIGMFFLKIDTLKTKLQELLCLYLVPQKIKKVNVKKLKKLWGNVYACDVIPQGKKIASILV